MLTAFGENFQGFLMADNGTYREPIPINNADEFSKFLLENVETCYELRVIDLNDMLVFHVVDQRLIFPIPPDGSRNNKWDSEKKKFVEYLPS